MNFRKSQFVEGGLISSIDWLSMIALIVTLLAWSTAFAAIKAALFHSLLSIAGGVVAVIGVWLLQRSSKLKY